MGQRHISGDAMRFRSCRFVDLTSIQRPHQRRSLPPWSMQTGLIIYFPNVALFYSSRHAVS